jgi:hypothetical protein
MATLKPITKTTLVTRYTQELEQIKITHPEVIQNLLNQAEETKATCLSLGLSEEAYNKLRNLLSPH